MQGPDGKSKKPLITGRPGEASGIPCKLSEVEEGAHGKTDTLSPRKSGQSWCLKYKLFKIYSFFNSRVIVGQ